MISSNVYFDLLKKLEAGEKSVVITSIYNKNDTNCRFAKKLLTLNELWTSTDNNDLNDIIYQKARTALNSGILQFHSSPEEIHLIEPFFPEPRLIIFGGGHIALPLVEFAAKVGFSVTVVDDRPSFANVIRFPSAKKVICESFQKDFEYLNINPTTFIVIVTRGHRHDLTCLKQVLKYNTAYIGMIGSKRRIEIVKSQLAEEGYPVEKLNKVNAPIGLNIGAITPEEIAISITAEIISFRRTAHPLQTGDSNLKVHWPELDLQVLEELSKKTYTPKAVVTILSTKGSVPRKAGAKMLVWPDGRTLGSIGGGCSEGEVINIARDVIRKGGFMLKEIDMTGSIAEEEGMVCGGIMQVFIEYYGN